MDEISDSQKRNENVTTKKITENVMAPLYWHAPASVRILDLKERHYHDVLRLLKRHFFSIDPVCRALNLLEDSTSIQSYLDLIGLWMRDTTSLVAVSSKSGRVVGVAIARINSDLDRSNTYSRIQIVNGDAMKKVMHIRNEMIKQADAYRKMTCEVYLRIYILCVHPSYESKGLRIALLEACFQMAKSLEVTAIGGIFTSNIDQKLATGLGFDFLAKMQYSTLQIGDTIVCDNPSIGDFSVAFMGMRIPSVDSSK